MNAPTFFSTLEMAVNKNADRTALVYNEGNTYNNATPKSATFQQLYDYVIKVNLGLKPGERVAVITSKPFKYLASLFAIDRNNGVAAPISAKHDIKTIVDLIEARKATKIIADPETVYFLAGNQYIRSNTEVIATERMRLITDIQADATYIRKRIDDIVSNYSMYNYKKNILVSEDISKQLSDWLKQEIKSHEEDPHSLEDFLLNGWKTELQKNRLMSYRLMSRFIPVGSSQDSLHLTTLEDKLTGNIHEYNALKENELAIIFHSAGLKGTPKGAKHSFKSILSAKDAIQKSLTLTEKDTVLNTFEAGDIMHWITALCSIDAGAKSMIPQSCYTHEARPCVEEHNPSILLGYAKMHQKILFQSSSNQPMSFSTLDNVPLNLRIAMVYGGFVTKEVYDFYANQNVSVINIFGQAEGISHMHVHSGKTNSTDMRRVGIPLIGVEQKISNVHTDFSGKNLGELLIKGDTLMIGYDGSAKNTKSFDRSGYFKTGIVAYVDSDETFIEGKKDRMVQVYDLRFYPEQLESEIIKIPYIDQVLVSPIYSLSRFRRKMIFKGLSVRVHTSMGYLGGSDFGKEKEYLKFVNNQVKEACDSAFSRYPLHPKIRIDNELEVMKESPNQSILYGKYLTGRRRSDF
jgi:acyl-CoA synthetase (AMP-forming)/AMP-acid ligase II